MLFEFDARSAYGLRWDCAIRKPHDLPWLPEIQPAMETCTLTPPLLQLLDLNFRAGDTTLVCRPSEQIQSITQRLAALLLSKSRVWVPWLDWA
jgi:hypothetical protein